MTAPAVVSNARDQVLEIISRNGGRIRAAVLFSETRALGLKSSDVLTALEFLHATRAGGEWVMAGGSPAPVSDQDARLPGSRPLSLSVEAERAAMRIAAYLPRQRASSPPPPPPDATKPLPAPAKSEEEEQAAADAIIRFLPRRRSAK